MNLTTYAAAAEFLAASQTMLEQHETANSLVLGLAQRLHEQPTYYETTPYLAVVSEGAHPRVVTLMTPPYKPVLASDGTVDRAALTLVAADLLAGGWAVPGVNGPAPLSAAFAQVWSGRTGQEARLHMQLRAYQLEKVNPPVQPPGQMRLATEEDALILRDWVMAFGRETGTDHNSDVESAQTMVTRALTHGNYLVWDDGGPVALAGKGRPTRQSVAIGPVYTPPAARNRGYASALVAALSQELLTKGKRYITLFTDLANPTANSIYQKIGFRPVVDFADYVFA